ncbi:MAG: hypothetical protein KGK05_06705 [Xanthomonadaceae bacterium]|nr:hypothetical protein [Xanthomonadaceae bacterium]
MSTNMRMSSLFVLLSFSLEATVLMAAPQSAPRIDMVQYVTSGLPNSFPTTFVFRKDGTPLLVAGPGDEARLTDFLSAKAELPVGKADSKQIDKLKTLLAKDGYKLANLISKTNAFTILNLEMDSSLGSGCAPCTARHDSISTILSSSGHVDTAYVPITLFH